MRNYQFLIILALLANINGNVTDSTIAEIAFKLASVSLAVLGILSYKQSDDN